MNPPVADAFDASASLDALPHGFLQVDAEDRIVGWNQQLEQWTRRDRATVLGQPIGQVYPTNHHIGHVIKRVRQWRQPQVLSQAFHGYFLPIPLPARHISGFRMMQQEVHLKPLRNPAGHVAITVYDVTAEVVGQAHARQLRVELDSARKDLADRVDELDESLREVRTLRSALDEHGQVLMFDPPGRVTFANDKFLDLAQRARAEVVGAPLDEVLGGHHDAAFFAQLRQRGDGGEVWRGDLKLRAGTGRWVWLSVTIVPFPGPDGTPQKFVLIGQDITERVEAEAAVKASLAEKEILLKEVHHRVKNNMQIISSMLQLQSGYLADPQFKAIFSNCRSRVLSMAMVHEKLYQSTNLASVDFGRHVCELSRMLLRSYGGDLNKVRLELATDPVILDIDTAIPVGLILNELVTNAVKYGHAPDEANVVRVTFQQEAPGHLLLAVEDNGPGLPAGFDLAQAKSLGLKLINILSRQIRGQATLGGERGLRVEIRFPAPVASAEAPAPVAAAGVAIA